MSAPAPLVIRIVKGTAAPAELAALTAVLLAQAAGGPDGGACATRPVSLPARWRRLERLPLYRAPRGRWARDGRRAGVG